MKFSSPEFLYAVGFLIIPILLHLFHLRQFKTVYFSQVSFLQKLEESNRTRSKLKQILVLISRCLALLFLVLAFAKPYIPLTAEIESPHKGVSIYIDNSFSMAANTDNGQLLDNAKKKAIDFVQQLPATEKYQIISNELNLASQNWLNKELAISKIQNIKLSAKSSLLSSIINWQLAVNKNAEEIINYLYITDLQINTFDLSSINKDSILRTFLVIEAEENKNISIDSLYSKEPDFNVSDHYNLSYILKNYSNDFRTELPVKLISEKKVLSLSKASLSASKSLEQSINFQLNDSIIKGYLCIKDYPVHFDDTLFFSWKRKEYVQLLHLYDEEFSLAIKKLFERDSLINYQIQSVNEIDMSTMLKSNFILLDGLKNLSSGLRNELTQFVSSGGSIGILPESNPDISFAQNLAPLLDIEEVLRYKDGKIAIGNIETESTLFKGVFESKPKRMNFPSVNGYYQLKRKANLNKENVILFENGDPFLLKYNLNSGTVYLFTASIDTLNSDLTNHALFVPLFYNMPLYSTPIPPLFGFIGEGKYSIKSDRTEEPIHLVGNAVDIIPKQTYSSGKTNIDLSQIDIPAGHYELRLDEKLLAPISLNYSRKESNLKAYSYNEFEDLSKNSGLNIAIYKGKDVEELSWDIMNAKNEVWKYFIFLTLLFLGLEMTLLRLIK